MSALRNPDGAADRRVESVKALWRANPALSASLTLTDKLERLARARAGTEVIS